MSSYRAQPEQTSTVGRAGPGRPVPGLRVDAWAAFRAKYVDIPEADYRRVIGVAS